MRVRFLRCTVADGGRVVGEGEVLDLPDHEARFLLSKGKVEILVGPPEGSASAAPDPQHRDPVVARTRGRRG